MCDCKRKEKAAQWRVVATPEYWHNYKVQYKWLGVWWTVKKTDYPNSYIRNTLEPNRYFDAEGNEL